MKNDTTIKSPWAARLLKRTGGFFLPLIVFILQIATNTIIGMAVFVIQFNAQLNPQQLMESVQAALILTLASNSLLLVLTYFLCRQAFARLQQWKAGQPLSTKTPEELAAWKQIATFPQRYGTLAVPFSIFIIILPLNLYQYFALKITFDQVVYTFLGGNAFSLIVILLGVIGIEQILAPAREVLIPQEFESQLAGQSGFKILMKTQIIVLALSLTTILLIAPLGYRQISLILQQNVDPTLVLRQYQIQSIITTVMILLAAAVVSYLLARSLSNPFKQITETVNRVEQGNLRERVRLAGSDEAGELAIYFNRMISRLEELQSSLEKQVEERTAQLEAVNEIGRAASATLDLNELVSQTINLITDRFGHYYAAIFLVDRDVVWANLKDATGEAGRVLKESRHRLPVGGKSMVGAAISERRARIALDVGVEPVRFNNPLLPYTRSEIALPLIAGDRVLGALDVQSMREAAFNERDIDTMQGMANQVAIALENARLYQEAQDSLGELRTVHRQFLQQAWNSPIQEKGEISYAVGGEPGESSSDGTAMNIPLELRDQAIGQILLEGDQEWTSEERSWVDAIATQAAIALENARLVEESQSVAAFEKLKNEITAKIWSSTTTDGILQSAIRELGRVLDVAEATIELSNDRP
jgi:GAF domain-containing protein/HAMP domain-containing protein